MILVDTSVWADHFRRSIPFLERALTSGTVSTHPFVIGELACGTLADRLRTLRDLNHLPTVQRASDKEVLALIERHALMGQGVGLVDVHLLAAAMLTPETLLWTHDKRLARIAGELSIACDPAPNEEA
jgi:predicted nucleic acid-binding protein